MYYEDYMIDWQAELNKEQFEAVTYDQGPLLVLAGAGSGKTRVLTYRVAYMIEEKEVPAEKILLLTFTNKAAGEMRERVEKLVGKQIGFAGTFHSFCARILRQYGNEIGLQPNFVIYDENDKKDALKLVYKELGVDEKQMKQVVVASIISNAKNELLTVDEYCAMAQGPFQKQVGVIWQKYQEKLRSFQAVDFDDLLILGVRLLEKEDLRERLTNNFEQILIDEYQDTNKVQYRLTKLLVNGRKNLTVVGDFSQSIYSWRGADFRNLNYLENDFGLHKIKLEQNYRSTQTILDAAYGVIRKNTGHPILELKAKGEIGEKIKTLEARDGRDEANFVIERVTETGDYNRFAVLYRTNAQSRTFEEAFIKAGIPYMLVGGVKFYERREIKDVLSYLRVMSNPLDAVSWNRIEKLGKRRMVVFQDWLSAQNKEIFEKKKTEELMIAALEVSQYLETFDRKNEEDLMRLENIKELMSVAKEFPALDEFLENVALVQSEAQSDLESGSGKVTLMTMHAAKGLEFEEVFIVGLEEGLFPHSRALMDRDQLEEERRLMYVAITRAKERLYMSYARRRLYFGQINSSSPSRFLSEVPESLLEVLSRQEQRVEVADVEKKWRVVDDWESNPRPVNRATVQNLVQDDFDEIENW